MQICKFCFCLLRGCQDVFVYVFFVILCELYIYIYGNVNFVVLHVLDGASVLTDNKEMKTSFHFHENHIY